MFQVSIEHSGFCCTTDGIFNANMFNLFWLILYPKSVPKCSISLIKPKVEESGSVRKSSKKVDQHITLIHLPEPRHSPANG